MDLMMSFRICILLLSVVLLRQTVAQSPPPSSSPAAPPPPPTYPTQSYLTLMKENDIITNSDIWDEELKIFTANYAFEGIKGVVNGTEEAYARAAGGAWMDLSSCATNSTIIAAYTTVATPDNVANDWGWPTINGDAMPIVMSWPAIPSTIEASDFEFTMNTGEKVKPAVASLMPNVELNERSTIVCFGEFGNRIDPALPEARYLINVEIVGDVLFVGPGGQIKNGRGLTYNPSNSLPYGPNAVGPKLVAAKLNHMSAEGEGTAGTAPNPYVFPNDCFTIYGKDVKYRLRMFTSGGFSPDGVSGVYPTDFEHYFRLQATLPSGEILILNQTGKDYQLGNVGAVKIFGLADLGHKEDTYNLCYMEDHDNQIDICLAGDEAAVRLITGLELPVGNATADPTGQYKGLYNPGGPGNNPTPGVNYTKPFKYQLQPVKMALDDPWTVSYNSSAPAPPSPTPAPSPSPKPFPKPSPPAKPSQIDLSKATATESSTNDKFYAKNAIDASSASYAQTEKSLKPWWSVKLPATYIVSSVTLTLPEDTQAWDVQVKVGYTVPTTEKGPQTINSQCALKTGALVSGKTRSAVLTCAQPLKGQVVTVQIKSTEKKYKLSLQNVKIFGVKA